LGTGIGHDEDPPPVRIEERGVAERPASLPGRLHVHRAGLDELHELGVEVQVRSILGSQGVAVEKDESGIAVGEARDVRLAGSVGEFVGKGW
jgi:hypothetical protein